MTKFDRFLQERRFDMSIEYFIQDIIEMKQKLYELQCYKEHMESGDITEAVLICHPKVAHIIRKTMYENKIKGVSIISTMLAEEDKLYMSTDKEFIKNARLIAKGYKQEEDED